MSRRATQSGCCLPVGFRVLCPSSSIAHFQLAGARKQLLGMAAPSIFLIGATACPAHFIAAATSHVWAACIESAKQVGCRTIEIGNGWRSGMGTSKDMQRRGREPHTDRHSFELRFCSADICGCGPSPTARCPCEQRRPPAAWGRACRRDLCLQEQKVMGECSLSSG